MILVAGVAACTAGGIDTTGLADDASVPVPEPGPPPVADGGLDAESGSNDAGPCTDCEYFPETCTSDVLCPNGPFAPEHPGGFDKRTRINVIRGRSQSDVWVAGALGALAHFDGASWRREDLGTRESMRGLWLRDSSEISLPFLQRAYGRGVSLPDGGPPPSADGWSALAPSYAAGQAPPGAGSAQLVSAWAAPGAEWLWCLARGISAGGIWRLRQGSTTLEGSAVIPASTCNSSPWCRFMSSVHGASADELWVVGESGATVRITNATGATPTAKEFDSQTWTALNGVWAASASEAWAVGVMGTIRHYKGDPAQWDVVSDVPTHVDLNAVWGSSSTDVWAVGDEGVVLHYDGKSWSRVKVAGLGAERPNLTAVWVAAGGHVWVGGEGVVLSLRGKQ
ncbi:MAG: hypothetical protein BGO98_25805 [Myxococcales bacterium 68-20]|nr:MAG: hypothetical protein BGO98_25805 [Myxococcales bacterium 68-20]